MRQVVFESFIKGSFFVWAAGALLGCGSGDADPTTEDVASVEEAAYGSSSSIWWNPRIPVCWENPSNRNAIERGWVRESVEQTWERVSAVDFTGWGACGPGARGVRVRISDERARTEQLGRRLDGVVDGMKLNFSYLNWNTGCLPSNREGCIRVDAVHEFGHALGFSHEQNRPDTNRTTCLDLPDGENGDMPMGAWDPNSVMNYCDFAYTARAWPWNLSPGDTQAVQAYYGAKPGSIVGLDGNCLDVTGFGTANGTPVQTWQCWGGAPQQWSPEWMLPTFNNYVRGYAGRCLDAYDGADRTRAVVWECGAYDPTFTGRITRWGDWGLKHDTQVSQSWVLRSIEIRGLAGKCMDVAFGGSSPGTPVWLYRCHGGTPQEFALYPDRTIRRVSDGMCLDAASDANGAPLQMWPCNGSPRQAWGFASGGGLVNYGNGKCADVYGWLTADATPVTLYDCHGGTNQRWSVRGQIHGLYDKCLDVDPLTSGFGAAVRVNACTGAASQDWEYFP